LVPIVYALIPHAFAEQQRALANSIYAVATRLGIGLAIWFCSLIIVSVGALRMSLPEPLASMETWRLSFLFAALPALVIAPLMFTIKVTESGRRRREASSAGQRGELSVLGHLLAHPRTLFGFFLGMGCAAFGFASIISWVPVIVGRMYGVEPVAAGAATGTATLIATVVGFLMSVVCQRLFAQRLGARLPIVFLSVASLFGALTSIALVTTRGPMDIYVLQGAQMATAIVALMIVPTALQDISPPPLRSRVIAINGISMIVFGALSPMVVGLVSDLLGERADALLLAALSAATAGLLLATLFFWWSAKTYGATVEASR
jgi:MFS family permease